MVFEYVPSTGVSELLNADALSLEDVKRIAEDTLAGLEHLHASGVFHRDIKPSNLLWTDQGVRIIDFNVAAHEAEEEVRPGGTRRYIPPDFEIGEILSREEEIDRDLYALRDHALRMRHRQVSLDRADPATEGHAARSNNLRERSRA